jgi:hypothetical protein
MKSLAVAAGAIHGLSLSIAYGGPVFAKAGLKRALRKIASKDERRAVMQTAWKQFSKVNVPAHVGFTTSWLVIRSLLRRIYLDRQTKRLLITNDVIIAGALITGLAATINGKAMSRVLATKKAKPGEQPKPVDKKEYNKLLRLEKKLGRANMAFLASAILIGPAIAMGVIRSQKMGFIARLLNR